jgi:PBP1b-binding outer membrane lipoprotein LpoB
MWYKSPEEDGMMRMLLGSCLITVALMLYPCVALGDAQSHRKAVENLLIVMEVDKSLPKIAEQVVDTQLQQNPQLAPQREIL